MFKYLLSHLFGIMKGYFLVDRISVPRYGMTNISLYVANK